MNVSKIAYSLLVFIATVVILYLGKDLILPLAIALMIFFIIKEQKKLLAKVKFKGKKMTDWLLSLLSFVFIVLTLFIFGNILYNNIQNVTEVIPLYQENINSSL